MKSSIFCQLRRTAVVTALALVLPNLTQAQTQLLVNPNWELGTNGWSVVNDAIGNDTVDQSTDHYYNNGGNPGAFCGTDAQAELVNVLTGTQCGKVYPGYNGILISGFFQTFAAAPGSTWSAGGFGYSSHEDLMSSDNFWYELDFYSGAGGTGTLLAAYESFEVTSLTCHETTPFVVDAWNGLPITNVMQVTTGTNTGTVSTNIAPGTAIVAPAGTASVAFRVVFEEIGGGGSMYLDNANLTELSTSATPGPAAPNNVTATLGFAANANAVLVSFYQNDASATGYNIYRSTNESGPYMEIATNAVTTTEQYYTGTNDIMYDDETAVAGPMAYFYQVQAVNGNGASANSAAAEVLYGQGNVLVDAGFEDAQIAQGAGVHGDGVIVGWDDVIGDSDDAYGYLNNSGNTYCNGCNSTTTCPHDGTAEGVILHTGAQMAKVWTVVGAAPYTATGLGFFHQTVTSPGGTWAAGGWTLESHEDLLAGVSFNFEVDFLDSGNNLLAAYESFLVTNLTCTELTPYPVDAWVYLAVTNQMEVIGGTNTGVVLTNTGPVGLMTAPHDTAFVTFQATAVGPGSGSTFFDDVVLDAVQAPVLTLPSITGVSPAILFSTNTNFSCVINSGDSVITNVQAIVTTSPLGGKSTTITDTPGSPGLTLTGLGTASVNVSLALSANLEYQVTVIGTDGNNLSVQTKSSFDTLQPTLVIEAADFNFSNGNFIDTPANGGLGLYTNDIGNQDVDEDWARNSASPANDSYRPGDNVSVLPAGAGNGIEQKFENVAGETNASDIPQSLGYDVVGDWLNYTRSFGSASSNSAPAGLYNVYADLAIVGTGSVNLYQVTGDITSSGDQTSNLLGSFTLTDNGWGTYEYTPLKDAFGNLITVNLTGTETLKAQISVSTPNVAFYFLVPSVGQAPLVTSVYPDGTEPFGPTNAFTFTVTPGFTASGPSTVSSNSISVTLNGVDVSSSLTLNNGSGSIPLTQQNVYTAVITATNAAGLVSVSTITFNNFDPNDYSVDFSDYDFSTNNGTAWVSGQFIDDAVPSADSFTAALAPPNYAGALATNSYFEYPKGFTPTEDPLGFGAIALQGVDIDFPENGQTGANNIYYRIDKNTTVGNNNDVGLFPSDDTTDGFRTKYLNARTQFSDNNIGSFQIGYFGNGNWLNYTRTYPPGNFYVWGRFAGHGGSLSNYLSLVTSGVGTSNQTTVFLGSFAGPDTGNYETFVWQPLLDASGNMANLTLGGKETLRLTKEANPVNALFLMLVPAPLQLQITPAIVSGQLSLSFQTEVGHNYTVVFKSDLTSPTWTPVGSAITGNGSVTNVSEALSGNQGFYTIKAQ